MKIKSFLALLFCAFFMSEFVKAQGNNLTSSPYSLFGLGVESNSNTGKYSGMGKTGISLNAVNGLNLYNPASFASIDKERFILDVGAYSELQSVSSNDGDEMRFANNFSNIAFGFNGNGNYGIGLTLKPSSDVGYALIGLRSNIEGSNDEFITNVMGSGGINELRLDYAYKLKDNLRAGIKLSYLFGSVDETESIITPGGGLIITDENYYEGFQVGFGFQYKLFQNYNFGLTLDLPTSLSGSRDFVTIRNSNMSIEILEEGNESIDNFELPLKLGFGFSTSYKDILFSLDYSKNLWSVTDQSDTIGDYVNQDIVGLGAEYIVDPRSLKYWKRINFRAGLNYNSGYLEVDETNIDTYSASLGIGFPIGRRSDSFINLSYTRGNRGSTDNILVEENFNTINLNISLSDIWFQKRKYN